MQYIPASFLFFHFYHASHHTPPSQVLFFTSNPSSFPLQERAGLQVRTTKQDKTRSKTRQSPYLDTGHSNPIGGEEPPQQDKESEKHLLPLLGVHKSTKLAAIIHAEDLVQTHAGPMLASSVSTQDIS